MEPMNKLIGCAAYTLALCSVFAFSQVQAAPFPATATFGTGPIQIALTSALSQFMPSGIVVTLTFDQPIAAPSQGLAASVEGYVDFDTDRSSSTGIASSAMLTNDPSPIPNVGADYYADLLSEQSHPGTIDIYNTTTGTVSGTVPITYGANSLTFTVPLSAFAGQIGPYNYDVVVGTLTEPTDAAPNDVTPLQTTSGTNTVITNGSFETPSVGSASYQYNSTGGWIFTGYSGIQSNVSAFGAANAPDGTQTAFLQGYFGQGALGSLSQSINFTVAGNYALTFQAAQRQGQIQPLRFSVDSVQVGGLLTPASNNFAPLTTAPFNISTAGAHTLTLSATNNSGDLTTFVDQITLAPAVINGSFETPSVGSASYVYNPTGGSWSFTGYSGIQSNGSAWYPAAAPDGTQTAFLQGYPGPAGAGSISQSVTFPAAGNFALTFQAARRGGQVQPLRFSVDGVQIGGLLSASGNSFGLLTSATFSIGTAGPHMLTLSATDNSGDLSTFVDQIALSSK